MARPYLLAAFLFCWTAVAPAQRPTTEQARQLLQTRPDLVAQLRQRIMSSGMTPEQVRARLRAEGYPEDLLDAYLSDARAGADSIPNGDVFAAVRALGIVDSTEFADLDSLMSDTTAARRPSSRRASRTLRDSAQAAERENAELPLEESELADSIRALRRRQPAIFGLNLFQRPSTQFEANLAGPVDANYRLGPGDQLVLILTGDVEAAYTLDVTREGFVVIPQVGQLPVANLTLAQLNDMLYSRLGRVYSGVRRGAGATTQFSVSVARLRSNQVFVVGDVARPGSYRVSSAGTAFTALYAAGGPTENGSMRRIAVRRGGRAVDSLDVYEYLLHGDASHDPRLETGDVVFVPVHGRRVQAAGEVLRPALYELVSGESLGDLIRIAGGFTPTASLLRLQIERIMPAGQRSGEGRDRVVIDVSAPGLTSGNVPPFALEDGDIVRVLKIADRVRARVVVNGNVWQEGAIGLRSGMLLSDALRAAGGLKPDTYLGQVLISRLRPDSSRVELRATLRDTTGAVVNDIPLQDDDEVRVFSIVEFRPQRTVAITGAVRKSGQYPYREGMTVRDLVLLAGGLNESASLQEAELARLPEDRSRGQTAATHRFPLDSSYLFERGPDGHYIGPPGLPAPSGTAPEQALLPYDNVLILRQPDFQLQRTVAVQGEVRFPGRYTLRTKTERLSDVIARAGGLTTESYAEGIQFYRARGSLGRIGVNLPRALRSPSDRDNLVLEDGDSVYLPRYAPVVIVTGAVNAPVAVAYQRGKRLDYYIRRAGGASRLADERRAYVRQPNGDVESRSRRLALFSSDPEPRAGSIVTVPQKDPTDKKDYTAIFGSVAQILASLVAIIVVVSRK